MLQFWIFERGNFNKRNNKKLKLCNLECYERSKFNKRNNRELKYWILIEKINKKWLNFIDATIYSDKN